MDYINQQLHELGLSAHYEAKLVTWDDSKRNQKQGVLSVWGPAISDVTLYDQSGRECVVIGPKNYDPRMTMVPTNELSVVAQPADKSEPAKPRLLSDVLRQLKRYTPGSKLSNKGSFTTESAEEVAIRVQAVIVPTGTESQFMPNVYTYNTDSDDDPKHLILAFTPFGLAGYATDGEGAKPLPAVTKCVAGDSYQSHWWKATAINDTQQALDPDTQQAPDTAAMIGPKGAAPSANTFQTLYIPAWSTGPMRSCFGFDESRHYGKTYEARLSIGDVFESDYGGLGDPYVCRDPKAPLHMTHSMYHCCDGFPSPEDIEKIVKKMDALLQLGQIGQLSTTHNMTEQVENIHQVPEDCWKKIQGQPYEKPTFASQKEMHTFPNAHDEPEAKKPKTESDSSEEGQ